MGWGRPRHPAHEAAQAKNERFYDPGAPCKYGHTALRYVCNHVCVACARLKNRGESMSGKKREWNQRTQERQSSDLGNYGGVPRHAPLSVPELETWGGAYPALMSGNWR